MQMINSEEKRSERFSYFFLPIASENLLCDPKGTVGSMSSMSSTVFLNLWKYVMSILFQVIQKYSQLILFRFLPIDGGDRSNHRNQNYGASRNVSFYFIIGNAIHGSTDSKKISCVFSMKKCKNRI